MRRSVQVHVNAVCTPKRDCADAHRHARTLPSPLLLFCVALISPGRSLQGVVIAPPRLMDSRADDLVHHLVDTVKKAQHKEKPQAAWDTVWWNYHCVQRYPVIFILLCCSLSLTWTFAPCHSYIGLNILCQMWKPFTVIKPHHLNGHSLKINGNFQLLCNSGRGQRQSSRGCFLAGLHRHEETLLFLSESVVQGRSLGL